MSKRIADTKLDRDNYEDEDPPEDRGVFRKASQEEMKKRVVNKAKRRFTNIEGNAPVFQNFAFGGVKKPNSSSVPSFSFLTQSKESSNTSVPMFGTNQDDSEGAKTSIFSFGSKSSDLSKSPNFNFTSGAKSDTKLDSSYSAKTLKFSPKPVIEENKKIELQSEKVSTENLKEKENIIFPFNTSKKIDENTSPSKTQFISSTSPKINGDNFKSREDSVGQNQTYLSKLKLLNLGLIKWIKQHVDKNPYVDLSPVFEDYKNHFSDLKSKYKTSGIKSASEPKQPKVSFSSTSDANSKGFLPFLSSKTEGNSAKSKSGSPPMLSFNSKSSASGSSPTKVLNPSTNSNTVSTFNFGTSKTSPPTSGSVSDFFKSTSPKSIPSSDAFKSAENTTKPFSFSSTESSQSSIFGSTVPPSMFSFGNSENKSSGFSFGTSTTLPNQEEAKKPEEETDEPPKEEIKEVKEEDAIYEKKVKLFYKKDGAWVDKGVGTLFLKKVESKTQLIIRAFTNLGNILLNIVLNESIPTQKQGKNNVLIVCVPNPPIDPKSEDKSPVPMLIKVKKPEDCDELLSQIESHKK